MGMTLAEREAKWAKWPHGDAGDAIDYALDHCSDDEGAVTFLEDWRMGRAGEWSAYMRWLNVQRDGARAASGMEAPSGDETSTQIEGSAVGDSPTEGTPQ